MRILKVALAATALTTLAAAAQAQDSGIYGNIGAEAVEFDSYNVVGRLGYDLNENFALEGQGSVGVIDDDVIGFDVGVDYSLAAFVKGSVPLGEQINLFARGGYHYTQIGVDGNGIDGSADFDGFAFGGGAEYMFTDRDGIRGDITFFDSQDDNIQGVDTSGTLETYSITYVRKF